MFLSLKWKALITTTVMLVVLGLIFSFQSNHQLRNLFENQRWATQQKNHEEIRNLLVHAFDQLLKFSDVVPLMVNHEAEPIQSHHPIRNMIDQHAQYIQINWGVESILLYDHLGKPLKSWNSLLAEKTHALATQVAHTSTPMNNLLCKAQCYQVTTTPILLHNGQTFILQLITSLGEIHSSFKKLTNANIGILFKNTDSSPPSDRFIAKWGYTVASMTDLEVMTTLLNQASNIVDFDSLKETPKTFRYEGRVFELQLVYAGEGQSDPYYFMIVSDLTEDYERINASLNAHLNVTTATTMLFGLLVVILIWNLINRLTLSSISARQRPT